jgi:hypothetical protein
MAVVYAAHTEACTLMLDERGICEWAAPTGNGRVPDRIVGAQFVASLDVDVAGALLAQPKEGVPMLFAIADENGRISLIRTTNLVRFDDRSQDSGIVRTQEQPALARSLRPSLEDIAPRGRTSSVPPRPPISSRPPASSNNNYAPPATQPPRATGAPLVPRVGRAVMLPSNVSLGAKRSGQVTVKRLVRR